MAAVGHLACHPRSHCVQSGPKAKPINKTPEKCSRLINLSICSCKNKKRKTNTLHSMANQFYKPTDSFLVTLWTAVRERGWGVRADQARWRQRLNYKSKRATGCAEIVILIKLFYNIVQHKLNILNGCKFNFEELQMSAELHSLPKNVVLFPCLCFPFFSKHISIYIYLLLNIVLNLNSNAAKQKC